MGTTGLTYCGSIDPLLLQSAPFAMMSVFVPLFLQVPEFAQSVVDGKARFNLIKTLRHSQACNFLNMSTITVVLLS